MMKPIGSLFCLVIFALGSSVSAQTTPSTTPPATQAPGASTPDASQDTDAQIVQAAPAKPKTPAELKDQAWSMLSTTVADQKHPITQIQCLGALGIMGSNARSLELIETAMTDKDVDVRTAAALAAGQTKAAAITTDLRNMLDDKEPQVAYIAALTLWKMHDRSGEDILVAVVDGDRRDSPKMMHGVQQTMYRELHDPAGLAKYGALQGAGMLLGPFGFGIAAFEYLHKNGGDVARAAAIEAIAQNRTPPIRKAMVAALTDKDLAVRAAAVKSLAPYKDPAISPEIAKLFVDTKAPVRLIAAAAYLVSTGVAPGSPPDPQYIPHDGKK
jgi:HEAT repeat protein